jgi:predicted nucleotide-binding protein
MTPDDMGCERGNEDQLRPRARQNVVLELGYFVGRLTRSHVAVLYKGSVELPSDYHGVLYIPMDDGDGWKLRLAKELKQAGMDVDLNDAL